MEGFRAAQEAYTLAIEACCTAPAAREAAPPTAPFATPFATPPSRPPPPPPSAPQRPSGGGGGGVSPEEISGVRRALFAGEGQGRGGSAVGEAPQEPAAAAATTTGLPPNNAQGGLGGAGVEAARGVSLGARSSSVSADAADPEGGDLSASGGKHPVAGGSRVQRPPLSAEQFEWVAIPGGRQTPPELDENGDEVADADAAVAAAAGMGMGMGGATSLDGASDGQAEGSRSARVGAGGGTAVLVVEPSGQEEAAVEAKPAGAAGGEGNRGMSGSPAAPPPTVSRVGAVSVLSPVAAAATAAPAVGVSNDGRGGPRAAAPAAAAPAAAAGKATAAVGVQPSGGDGDDDGGGTADLSSGSGSPAEDAGIEWQRAKAVLDDMVAADHLPSPPAGAYRAVLDACDAAGEAGEALEVASAMVDAGHSPSKLLVARLMASHADVLDRERREMEEAAAAPAEDWGDDGWDDL